MGKYETEAKKRSQRANLKKLILQTVAGAGLLGVAAVAPNVISAMAKLGLPPLGRQTELINTSRKRLVQQGLLIYEDGNLRLTKKGERIMRMLDLRDYHMKKPKHWDYKWRILIFDIPERRKGLRERVREILRLIGFVRLQDSVWVYPYDCEDVCTLLKADLHIGRDMLYLIVESLENDARLRQHFQLR
jgi:DNA-binding transcriptional regulator PaaX